jgi:CheY-like chemotaxis protein
VSNVSVATVLIVDDEQPLRELLADVLEAAGHRVIHAHHGQQALEQVARERPDLVISDVMMPVLNGRILCQRLKADPATRALPVILMTSAGQEHADGVGADDFLAKPFGLDEIERLIRHWLPAGG